MENNDVPQDKYALRSVGRALDILETLEKSSEGMGVGEIAEAIGTSRSTAFTLLQTLVARGFVADLRVGSSRSYRLGLSLIHLGDRAQSHLGITQVAAPVLRQLTEITNLTSRLAVFDEGCAVSISRFDAPGLFRMTASLGRRELPHSSSIGKALLARMPDDEVLALLKRLGMPRRTERTLTRPDALLKELHEVSRRGYAFDDEEDNVGIVCVGAPVYGRSSQPVAVISVTTIKLDGSAIDLHALGAVVRAHADRISVLLGGPTHVTLPARTSSRRQRERI